MSLKVIGAGHGRTGTRSLKEALETLGFGPCYHMEELLEHPEHVRGWHELPNGLPPVSRWTGRSSWSDAARRWTFPPTASTSP